MSSNKVLVYIVQATYTIALSWFIELYTRGYSVTITYDATLWAADEFWAFLVTQMCAQKCV